MRSEPEETPLQHYISIRVKKTEWHRNVDWYEPVEVYTCIGCGEEVKEMWPRIHRGCYVYCIDCAFKYNVISEKEYIERAPGRGWDHGQRAFVNEDFQVMRFNINSGIPESHPDFNKADSVRSNLEKHKSEIKQAVISRDGKKCQKCGATEDLTIDHINPISRGGENDLENLQLLCQKCNSSKGAKTKDYRAEEINGT